MLWILHHNINTQKATIFKQKNTKNHFPFQNGGQITDFRFAWVISILAKIWNITFLNKFFNEIWLIIGDYEYINITEKKLDIFIPVRF